MRPRARMTHAWHRIARWTVGYVMLELTAIGTLYHFAPHVFL